MKSNWGIVPLAVAVLAGHAVAQDGAPRLPDNVASGINDLGRAVYACMSGASHFVPPLPKQAHTQFPPVLGGPYHLKPGGNILRLSGTTLTGTGNTPRTDGKVNRFTFTCELTPDLREATAFTVGDVEAVARLTYDIGPDPTLLPAGARPVWSVDNAATMATLTHGVAGTDTNDFEATCATGSGSFTWHIPFAPPDFDVGREVSVTAYFESNGDPATHGLYIATITADSNAKKPTMTATISTDDPMLRWLERNDQLIVQAFGSRVTVSLKGSSAPAKQFAAACAG